MFDRDVFIKLICCDLWNEANASLGLTQSFRLQSTSTMQTNHRVVKRLLGEVDDHISDRISKIIASVPVITNEMMDGLAATSGFQVLNDIEDIDQGEHFLAAILLDNPDDKIMLSGDKRFIKAFREQAPEYWKIAHNNIISFESCLLAIEKRYGFEFIINRAHSVKRCDTTLRIALGTVPNAEEFRAALRSYDPLNFDEIEETPDKSQHLKSHTR